MSGRWVMFGFAPPPTPEYNTKYNTTIKLATDIINAQLNVKTKMTKRSLGLMASLRGFLARRLCGRLSSRLTLSWQAGVDVPLHMEPKLW
jgi:hypothetical protein